MSNIMETDSTYVADTYARFPVVIQGGHGSVAFGEDGREYIDLGSGIAVNVFGYSDGAWVKAVSDQLHRVQHTSNLYYTGPCAELAKELCERTGMRKVFFCNSGAEANECAIKAARRYGELKHGKGCSTIITLKDSFHGRTLTTLSATGQDHFHELFQPLTPGFVYAEGNDLDSVKQLIETNDVCGVMIETVQGEGGVNVMTPDFVKGVRALCDEHDLIMIIDEVQTGNGRTGSLYSFQGYGILPDVATTAKGLGGGLPIGATMLSEKLQDIFHPGDNGSTFGGNPAVAAGALCVLKRIDEDCLTAVKEKSKLIFQAMEGQAGVKSVRGLGLMIGIEPEYRSAKEIAADCLKDGVLVLTAGKNRVRLLPTLNIPEADLMKALEVLKKEFAKKEGNA